MTDKTYPSVKEIQEQNARRVKIEPGKLYRTRNPHWFVLIVKLINPLGNAYWFGYTIFKNGEYGDNIWKLDGSFKGDEFHPMDIIGEAKELATC